MDIWWECFWEPISKKPLSHLWDMVTWGEGGRKGGGIQWGIRVINVTKVVLFNLLMHMGWRVKEGHTSSNRLKCGHSACIHQNIIHRRGSVGCH